LVRDGHVSGWDDPPHADHCRVEATPLPPAALREFVKRMGGESQQRGRCRNARILHPRTAQQDSLRRMAVLRPLKIVIENYPERPGRGTRGHQTIRHPDAGTRRIAFGRELYIEQDDFMENPPEKFFRLSPGNEVRMRYAYFIKCTRNHQERRRRGGRAALYLRSRDPRPATPGRAQGQGHHALALRGAVTAAPNPRL